MTALRPSCGTGLVSSVLYIVKVKGEVRGLSMWGEYYLLERVGRTTDEIAVSALGACLAVCKNVQMLGPVVQTG